MDDTRLFNGFVQISYQQGGFTLIELLVAVSILAILSMAVPALSDVIARASRDSAQGDLMTLLAVARGEAIQRQQQVTLCRGSSSSCSGTSVSGDTVWESALMFVDTDQDREYDSGSEDLIQYADFTGPVTVTWSKGDSLAYEADGTITGYSLGSFDLLATGNNSHCSVILSLQGRARQECD